jgi:O-antigen/teichoic acid export membrane protein
MLKFGGQLTANKLFDGLASSADSLLLGKLFSAEMLGFYTRAQALMLLPLSQIMPALLSVSLPVMSRLAERPETLKRVFLDLLQLTAFASSFIVVFTVVCADWLISVFLGPRWMDTSDIFRLLAGAALFIPLSNLCVASLTAQGKGAALMHWSLLKNITIIFAICGGITWGAKGVAAALSIVSVCILIPLLNYITSKAGSANLKEIWWATGPGIGFGAFGCGVLYVVRHQLELGNPLMGLLVLFLINCILHALIVSALPSSRAALGRLLSVF